MKKQIDQEKDMLIFKTEETIMNRWDHQINIACNSVSSLADKIIAMHPEYKSMLQAEVGVAVH
ncbi:hypothetical protein DIPPA_24163 [Diplonema papillatum]|nr:hypothetical protein DIPPA_24163 [Diplonema papillatum]